MPAIAVVGAAHIHTPEFLESAAEHAGTELAGVFDPDPDRARSVAERFGAPVLGTAAEAYDDPSVDGIVITSQTCRHRQLAVAAARAGKALFVEKPLGASASDARAIADAVAEARTVFQTGYFLRGDPAHLALRALIADGALGELTRVRVVNSNPAALLGWLDGYRWMTDRAQAGVGGWGDEGAHAVDLLRWLTGREVRRALLATASVAGRYGDVDDHGEALLELDGGLLASIGAGWVDRDDVVHVHVTGTGGQAWVAGRRLWVVGDGAHAEEPIRELPEPWPHAFVLFLDALAGRDVPLVGVRDAAATTAVLEAAYASAATGTWARPAAV